MEEERRGLRQPSTRWNEAHRDRERLRVSARDLSVEATRGGQDPPAVATLQRHRFIFTFEAQQRRAREEVYEGVLARRQLEPRAPGREAQYVDLGAPKATPRQDTEVLDRSVDEARPGVSIAGEAVRFQRAQPRTAAVAVLHDEAVTLCDKQHAVEAREGRKRTVLDDPSRGQAPFEVQRSKARSGRPERDLSGYPEPITPRLLDDVVRFDQVPARGLHSAAGYPTLALWVPRGVPESKPSRTSSARPNERVIPAPPSPVTTRTSGLGARTASVAPSVRFA